MTHPDPSNKIRPEDNAAIWVLLVSSFVVILNETIMGVALPELMRDLHVKPSVGQWLTTAFLLTMSIVIPVTGILIQRWSTRTLFFIALTSFILGTALCAFSPGFGLLVIGRVVQAVGTAIMLPLLMTTTVTVVPERHRGRIMGRISIVMSAAPAIGPTVSGLVLQYLSWRWMFFIMLPIAITAIVIGGLTLKNISEKSRAPIDGLSVVLSAFGFGGLVYGLSAIGERASGSDTIAPAIPIVVGVIGLVLFTVRQVLLARNKQPLLDLRVFRSRPYTLATTLLVVSMMSLFGMIIVLPIYAANVLGLDMIVIGLLLLPGGLLMAALGPVVGRVVDQRGARILLVPGTFLTAGSMWMLSAVGLDTSVWYVLACHLVLSLGLACTFTPLFSVSLGSLPVKLASHGSATISTLQQLAGAAGTAMFITIMSVAAASAGSNNATTSATEALAVGVQASFFVGALIATAAITVGFFIREASPAASSVEAE
ncbi:MAG: MDR family MFS transporter [Canibacter sp.]